MKKPTKNGYHWLEMDGKDPIIVEVFDIGEKYIKPGVIFHGDSTEYKLEEVDGEFFGPFKKPGIDSNILENILKDAAKKDPAMYMKFVTSEMMVNHT